MQPRARPISPSHPVAPSIVPRNGLLGIKDDRSGLGDLRWLQLVRAEQRFELALAVEPDTTAGERVGGGVPEAGGVDGDAPFVVQRVTARTHRGVTRLRVLVAVKRSRIPGQRRRVEAPER